MNLKKSMGVLLISFLLFSINGAEITVKNKASVPVKVLITEKQNKEGTIPPVLITHEIKSCIVQSNEETVIILDQTKLTKNAIIALQGAAVAPPFAAPITSNEQLLNGYEASIIFKQEDEILICEISQVVVDDSSLNPFDKNLYDIANQASDSGYAPHSCSYEGAAIETMCGNVFAGSKVEHSAKTTTCAEIAAISAAILHEGQSMKIKTIVFLRKATDSSIMNGGICSICKQAINEFATAQTRIIYRDNDKLVLKSFKSIFAQ